MNEKKPMASQRTANVGPLTHWIRLERQVGFPIRLGFILLSLWIWREEAMHVFQAGQARLWWIYVTITLLGLGLYFIRKESPLLLGIIAFLQWVDAAFVGYVVYQSGSITGMGIWLFVPWLGKQALLAAFQPRWYLVTFIIGPLYLGVAYLRSQTLTFLLDRGFQQTYIMLLAVTLGGGGLARYIHSLHTALAQEREDLAQQTAILQRTASDLGARVLELRALQEIAHHLSLSLHLEETLDVIGRRAKELFSATHVAIFLIPDTQSTWSLAYLEDTPLFPDPPQIAAEGSLFTSMAQASPQLIRTDEPELASSSLVHLLRNRWTCTHLFVIPLITRGRLVAVLVLTGPTLLPQLDERQEQLAESFAFLAATAIENARLYENVLEQRQELEAVLQGIGDAVIVTDANLNILMVNPVAIRTLHLPSSPEGLPLASVIQNEDLLKVMQDVLIQEEPVIMRDITFEFPGDKPRTFQAVASAVVGPGLSARGVVTVLRDITAQKELEKMKSNFLSVVSHELKTPLHSIKGFVEIIRMGKAGPITELQADFLTTVKEQTQVLQRMIDDLLVFSRLEAGQLRLHAEEISLAAIAAGVVQKLTPLAEEKGIALTTLLPDDFPDIQGDYMRMEQVITNLVENAIKFTPTGGKVTIEGQDLGDRVRIWVQDTGIGIPESERERIFDRFYQVDASERRAYRGAGLGLTICKHIVERHGGRIWVESQVGKGSTFYIELPKRLPVTDERLDFLT